MKKFMVVIALLFYGMNGYAANGDLVVNGSFNLLPPGTIVMFGGSTAPTGWLIADGSAVSRTTYAGLFTAIGTSYGAGDGSTSFNLPDFRRRVAVGAGGTATGILGNTVGSAGGEENHMLTVSEMPSHSHTIKSYDEADPGSCNSAGVNCLGGLNYPATTNTGGGEVHNNMQPSLVVNYIVKY